MQKSQYTLHPGSLQDGGQRRAAPEVNDPDHQEQHQENRCNRPQHLAPNRHLPVPLAASKAEKTSRSAVAQTRETRRAAPAAQSFFSSSKRRGRSPSGMEKQLW